MLNYAMRPVINPLTLLLTVLGFMFFWPLGLLMLAYMFWGGGFHAMQRHFADMRSDWANHDWGCGSGWGRGGRSGRGRGYGSSGNAAFDDYRQKEMQRLEEERRRLDEELRDFEAYMTDLRRARDQEEFDRFRRDRASRPPRDNTSESRGGNVDL